MLVADKRNQNYECHRRFTSVKLNRVISNYTEALRF